MKTRLTICLLVLLFLPTNWANAWQVPSEPFAERSMPWSCVMPAQVVELRYLDRRPDKNERISWMLKKDHRTLARGPVQLSQNNEFKIEFTLPEIEATAAMELTLKLTAGDRFVSEPLYLFPASPFKDRQTFLEDANLFLFDPVGDTNEVFESASIPFHRLDSLDSVGGIDEGLLLIGEGLAIDENEDLTVIVPPLLEKGVSVILLAPNDDGADQPTISIASNVQPRITLQRQNLSKRFDKRFDTDLWSGENSVSQSWQLSRDQNTLCLESAPLAAGWCWVEMESYRNHWEPKKKAVLVVCGLRLIDAWADGPMPRHLLLKMIETYSKNN